jgi:hypothetical protein
MGSGSSGSGAFWEKAPQDIAQQIRDLESKAQSQEYESSVASYLGDILAQANDRDVDAVAGHLDAIRDALGKDIDGSVDLMFGGSVAKRTYVAGVSDVDALVVINGSDLADLSPSAVCEYIEKRLRERFSLTSVTPDGFAIDVKFSDVTVGLVPVIRRGDDYLLPSTRKDDWSRVRPRRFTDALTEVNKRNANKVVPTIKLAKVLMDSLPEARRVRGYHTELLATQIFAAYQGPVTPKAMLHHFFASAPALIRTPTPDPTGQTPFVDSHLGPANSVERLMIADSVDRIGRRLRNADSAGSLDQWRDLFGAR